MHAECVNAFVIATTSLFERMLACRLKRGSPFRRDPKKPYGGLSGVITMRSHDEAMVVLNLSRVTAISAASAWLTRRHSKINGEVFDAVGELVSIIGGQARAWLSDKSLSNVPWESSLPIVYKELWHHVPFPSDSRLVSIPFESQWGLITVDFAISQIELASETATESNHAPPSSEIGSITPGPAPVAVEA